MNIVNPMPFLNPNDFFENLIKEHVSDTIKDDYGTVYNANNRLWNGTCESIEIGNKNVIFIVNARFFEEQEYVLTSEFEDDYLRILFKKREDDSWATLVDFLPHSHKDLNLIDRSFAISRKKEMIWVQKKDTKMKLALIYLHKDWAIENFIWNTDYDLLKWVDMPNYILTQSNFQRDVLIKNETLIEEVFIPLKARTSTCYQRKKDKIESLAKTIISQVFGDKVQAIEKNSVEQYSRLLEAEKLLIADFRNDPPTLNVLAKTAGMNRKKFQQVFKNIFGKTFYQYYQEHRFEYARYLIEHKGHISSEAAFMIGYKNFSHFSEQFIKIFGIKPSDLKKDK